MVAQKNVLVIFFRDESAKLLLLRLTWAHTQLELEGVGALQLFLGVPRIPRPEISAPELPSQESKEKKIIRKLCIEMKYV